MVEYRPLPADRREEAAAMLSYAFSPEEGRFEPEDEDDEWKRPARVGDRRGLFDGDELVSVCSHVWFDARLRDESISMAGLSAVATPPEHRRHGYVRTLLRESLTEYRDREVPIVALWPFKTPFYERFGWATAFRTAVQVAEPTVFRLDGDATGRFYSAEEDDWPALDHVLEHQFRRPDLAVSRTEEWWRNRVFHSWGEDPYVYVWERDDQPAGYVVYTIEDADEGREFRVWDMVGVDEEARVNLLRFVADHDSQVERARLYGPIDSILLDEVENPADLEVTVDTGAMVRIVDVHAALEAVAYPDGVAGHVTLAVSDPLVEWNEATVEMEVADGNAQVVETDGAPDLSLSINALSALLVGYRTADELVTVGEMTVHGTDDAVAFLDDALPKRRAFIREWF